LGRVSRLPVTSASELESVKCYHERTKDHLMAALGFAAVLVWVPHPIQNRSPAELVAIADDALEKILSLIQH